MPEIENFAEHSFELARRAAIREEDIALEAFELLTANNYDLMLAHALGVRL